MVRKSPLPTSLLNRYVRFVDFLDYVYFGIADFVEETRQRFGKLLCTLLTVVVIFVAITIVISIIVCIVMAVKRKKEETSDATTTQASDKGMSTATVRSTTTTGSLITTNSPSSSKNTLSTKTSMKASTIASTTIYASTTSFTDSATAWSSTSALITTTAESTTDATEPVTATKPPAQKAIHCACAADLHNLNNDTELLKKEKGLVVETVEEVFKKFEHSTAGLWVYGYVNHKPSTKGFNKVFDEMKNDYLAFSQDANVKMDFGPNLSPHGQNLTDAINDGADPLKVANCLLLLSGMKEVSQSWRIEPRYGYKRIVIVSLQGANFTNHVDSRGIAVNVPFDYTPLDVERVFQAIASGFT